MPSKTKISLALALLLAAGGAHARTLGTLEFEPCSLAAELMPVAVEAQCTTLSVPEDRTRPDGRKVALAIAWVPSSSKQAADDPVFMLAGGPGQSARDAYPTTARAFRDVLRERHVILLDQRGTGGSNALKCANAEGESAFGDVEDQTREAQARFARECLAALDADPRFYTTTEAVADLDAVREAIGARQIDLIGISYGTRVAQEYLRRHPDHVRAVVLDGVVPPELVLGSEHAKNLEAALDAQFARCAKDPACAKRFGTTRETLTQLLARVAAQPQDVRYFDPVTHEVRTAPLTRGEIAAVVRLYAYAPTVAALLPLALHEALSGRPEALMAQARMLQSLVGEQIMHGMQLSVICAEDADLLVADPADAASIMGTELVDMTQAQCEVWPRGTRPQDFHAPLASDKPVLLLSGELDPVTPPRYGEQVLKGLPNARHIVARGQGHNVVGVGCMPKVVADFLKKADAKGLDAKCLEQLDYTPFFTGYHGWEP